ncbi:hypothetical protein [Lysinibacillus sp. NPDC059133]
MQINRLEKQRFPQKKPNNRS